MANQLAASLIDGLLIGFVYGVAAMGLTLIWGVVRIINLAHGAVIALAMFGIYFLVQAAGLNPYIALPLVALGGLAAGYVIYALAVRRVVNAPPLASLLATFAVNMILIGTATTAFTTSPYSVPFDLGGVNAGLGSDPGALVRAVDDARAAAGGLIATFFPFTILSGDAYQLKSFVIVVLGGLGNPLGALAGGLILGILEGLVPVFTSASWVPVIEFGLFVVILLVLPNGVFGGRK